jgi:hypothetical protein
MMLLATARPAEALAAYQRAQAIFERLARQHPESPDCASKLGGTFSSLAAIDFGAERLAEACDR